MREKVWIGFSPIKDRDLMLLVNCFVDDVPTDKFGTAQYEYFNNEPFLY
jgi:hypothetical protein